MRLRTHLEGWWRALRTQVALRGCAEVGQAPWVAGRVWIHGGGRVCLGNRVRLDGRSAPIELHALPGAELRLGDDVRLEGGASVEAHARVTIGAGCALGGYCKVIDNHFHPLTGDRHARPTAAPVELEPGVVVGWRAIILPGARVRQGSVVAPGVVVRGRAP